ncbi:hypothetical protein IWQ60_002097 [Tieghemiomyces parasiticus]|uniref:Uncharacterized protein n=1 Tax=Tieghemiomyces parasiticus TaxID=78921 RepID=A0A9W8DVZ9_9FUNG|nr:hypothetical protein IWQ60_002097 [Tieghemiomyces parasiticus]
MKAVAAPAAVMSNLAVSASSQIVPSATVTTQNAHGVNARFTNDHVPSPVPSAPVEATTAVSADPLPLATPPSGRRRSALHRQASDSARATPKSVRFSPQPVRSVIPGRTATGSPTRRSGTPGSSGDPAKETERPPAFVAEPLLTYAPRAPLQRHRGRTDKQSAERVRYLAENPHYIYHPDNQQRSERAILEAELEVSTVTQFVNPLVAAHCRLRIRATDGVSYRALSMGVEGVRPGATRSGVVNNRYSTGALAAGVVETALSANDPAHRVEALVDAAPTPAQTPPAARLYRILPPAYLLPLANHACLTMRCANLGDVLHDPTLLIAAADQSYMHHLEETLVPPPHPRTPGPEALRHYSEGHVSHALTSLSTLDSAGVRKSYPFKPTVVPTYLAGHVAAAVGGHYLFESTEPSAVTVSSAVTRQAVHSALGGTHELVPTPLVLPSHQLAAINPWGNADTLYTTSAEVLVLPEGAEIRAHWRMEGQPYGFSLEPGRADRGHWWDLPSHPRRGHTVADGFRPADREDDLDTKHRRRLAFLDALPNPRNNQGYPQHCVVAFYAQNITPLYPKYGLDPALRRHHPQLKTRRVQAVRDRLRAQSKDRELDTYARNMAIPAGLGYHATTMV